MAEITAQLVKDLREATGAGMMECKKALVEASGEIEKAVDVLRTKGLSAAAKKAGRETNEGIVDTFIAADGKSGAIAEVNCETDFVSSNETYKGYVEKVVKAVLENSPADADALKASSVDGTTVDDVLIDGIHKLGENITVSRFDRLEVSGTGAISTYIHAGGKIGVLVQFSFGKDATAQNTDFIQAGKDIAMQVAAFFPLAVDRDSFPADELAHELEIYKAQAAASGKPEAIQEKIAQGRLDKYFKETTLLELDLVKDPETTVQQLLDKVGKSAGDEIKVDKFVFFELGK